MKVINGQTGKYIDVIVSYGYVDPAYNCAVTGVSGEPESYPNEDLVFISKQSLSKIKEPIFEIFCQKTGGFRTDFLVFPTFSDFIDSCEDEYQNMEEINYALAA